MALTAKLMTSAINVDDFDREVDDFNHEIGGIEIETRDLDTQFDGFRTPFAPKNDFRLAEYVPLCYNDIAMIDAPIGAAQGRNADMPRRAGLRLKGRESWRRLFQRGRRNLRSVEGFIAVARRIIDVCETIAAEHPIQAVHDMARVSGLLAEAAERFGRVCECISETYDRIAEAPGASGDAPARMIADMQRWIETGTKLALLGNRFDKSFAELIEYAHSGTAPLDLSELLKRRTHPVPVLARHPRPKVLSVENDRIFCIHLRRQRPVRLATAEAPKRVSRGRAPPPVSICSL